MHGATGPRPSKIGEDTAGVEALRDVTFREMFIEERAVDRRPTGTID
jgi:hypothetical protein